jgi:hypothetical protein
MNLAIRLVPEPVRTIAAGSIGVGYSLIGSTGFENPCRIFYLQNLTDATLMFSFNGVDDHFPLLSNSFLLLDITSNKTVDVGAFIAQGQPVYVKQVGVPTGGAVYLTVFYGTAE